MSAEVFEWNGRGSVRIVAEHEHVHLHGKCVKNRYGVECTAPTGRVGARTFDIYGQRTVYTGRARERRYHVWFGSHSGGGFTGHRQTFRSLLAAKVVAKSYQRRGYDTKITDRLVRPGDTNVIAVKS